MFWYNVIPAERIESSIRDIWWRYIYNDLFSYSRCVKACDALWCDSDIRAIWCWNCFVLLTLLTGWNVLNNICSAKNSCWFWPANWSWPGCRTPSFWSMRFSRSLRSLRPPVVHLKRGIVERFVRFRHQIFKQMKNKQVKDSASLRTSPEFELMWSTTGLSLRCKEVFTSRDPCPLDTSTPHDEGCSLWMENIKQRFGDPGQISGFVDYLNGECSQSPHFNITDNLGVNFKHYSHVNLCNNIYIIKVFCKKK